MYNTISTFIGQLQQTFLPQYFFTNMWNIFLQPGWKAFSASFASQNNQNNMILQIMNDSFIEVDYRRPFCCSYFFCQYMEYT